MQNAAYATTNRYEIKKLLHLMLPILVTQFAQAGFGLIDTVMAGHLSANDLAAIAVGVGLWIPIMLLFSGIMIAATPLVAEANGARAPEKIAVIARQSLWVALILGIIACLILQIAPLLLPVLGVPEALLPKASLFLHAIGFGMPAVTMYAALRGYSEALGFPRPVTAISLIALLLLILVERRAQDPILPAHLARLPGYLVSVLLALASQLLMFAVLVYLPLQMQWQKGMSASDSGGIMVIFMVCITAGAFVGGKLIGRTGHYKRFVVAGFALAALALWQIHFDVWARLGLGFAGLGLGLVLPALSVVVQNALPREDRGIGMSLFNFGRELGGAVGVAICAVLFHAALPAGSSPNLVSLSPAELAPGFSATYIGMALIATAALLVTLLALKRHELASKHV